MSPSPSRLSVLIALLLAIATGAPSPALAQDAETDNSEPLFPLWREAAGSRDVDLPLPFGVGLQYVHYEQVLDIENLVISSDRGNRGGIDFVETRDTEMTNRLTQLSLDLWLFPFLNVFAQIGSADNTLRSGYTFSGEDVVAFVGDESRCDPDAMPRPDLCDRTFNGIGGTEPSGDTLTLGTIIALGRGPYFVVTGLAWSRNDLDTSDSPMESVSITPRLGRRFPLDQGGTVAVFAGGLYVDSDVTFSRSETVPTRDGPVVVTLSAEETNADPLSFVAGAQWDMVGGWSLLGELGYGPSREGFIASLKKRF